MKRSWATLSQLSNGAHTVQDFERAAFRLVTEQVLYASDRFSRTAYHLIEDHFDDFAGAVAPLGIRLERNSLYRYVIALPQHAEGMQVTLDETLLVLVLRHRYDEAVRQGQLEEQGEVIVELPDLQEAYPALAGRPMPEVGTLRNLAKTLKRWGVGRLEDGDPDGTQPFHLVVRPAIVEIIGEQWLHRLDQHNRADDDGTEVDDILSGDDDAAA